MIRVCYSHFSPPRAYNAIDHLYTVSVHEIRPRLTPSSLPLLPSSIAPVAGLLTIASWFHVGGFIVIACPGFFSFSPGFKAVMYFESGPPQWEFDKLMMPGLI